jgi:hypothetical protein
VTVEGARLAFGEATGVAVELGAVVAAVEVNGQLPYLLWQFMVEGDASFAASAAANRRPREAAAEGPEPRFPAGEDLLLGFPDRDADVVFVEDRRDRQAVAKGDRGKRRRRLG